MVLVLEADDGLLSTFVENREKEGQCVLSAFGTEDFCFVIDFVGCALKPGFSEKGNQEALFCEVPADLLTDFVWT